MSDQSLDRLLGDALRGCIEQTVSAHLSRAWRAATVASRASLASHPAAVLSDATCSVFVKLGNGPQARDKFDREVAGLRLLTERSGVLTPTVIANLPTEGGALIITEAVQVIERQSVQWRQMGEALARPDRSGGVLRPPRDRSGHRRHFRAGLP